MDTFFLQRSEERFGHRVVVADSGAADGLGDVVPVECRLCNYNEIGDFAEWITERPTLEDGTLPELAQYGTVNFSEANVTNALGGYYPVGQENRYQNLMWNCQDTVELSAPSYLSSVTSFTDTWMNSGTGGQQKSTCSP